MTSLTMEVEAEAYVEIYCDDCGEELTIKSMNATNETGSVKMYIDVRHICDICDPN